MNKSYFQFKFKLPILWMTLILLSSCGGKDFFNANKLKTTSSTNAQVQSSSFQCSNFTTIRPKVDLLFVWDNSSSSVFISPQTKQALNNVVTNVAERFDYHIMMAPLVGTSSPNQNSYFFSNISNLNPGNGVTKISRNQATSVLDSFPTFTGSAEAGLDRVQELLRNNQSNGIFRQNAYTVIVMMSNQDDNSYITTVDNSRDRANYLNLRKEQILCLRGNYNGSCSGTPQINSQMMRMISIVAVDQARCSQSNVSQFKLNYLYREMSRQLYITPYTNGNPSPQDQLAEPFDTYDICRENYTSVFDQVNSTIQDIIVAHSYRFWPVADSNANIDLNSIRVFGDSGVEYQRISNLVSITEDLNGKNDVDSFGNKVTGFRFLSSVQTRDTRFLPTSGEPFTGYMIQLFGDAKPTYPSCLRVDYSAPSDYFGYVRLASKPVESSIELRINGQAIPQSSVNGWQLVKDGSGQPQFINNQNIKITSPTNRTPATPQQLESGYFLQVFGSAVYTNGASVEVVFDPAGG